MMIPGSITDLQALDISFVTTRFLIELLIAFLALTLTLTTTESGLSRRQAVNHRITQLEDHIQW
jgi:hypothetical protein